jgi:hypothetical protein
LTHPQRRKRSARAPRAVQPAWWLLSEDLALDGDFGEPDDEPRQHQQHRKCQKPQDDSNSDAPLQSPAATQTESDLTEAIHHAVRIQCCCADADASALVADCSRHHACANSE